MSALRRDHVVIGPYKMQGGKLTFRTTSPDLARDARQAMSVGTDFAVLLSEVEDFKDASGHVLSIELVAGVKPALWEIVMQVTMPSAA